MRIHIVAFRRIGVERMKRKKEEEDTVPPKKSKKEKKIRRRSASPPQTLLLKTAWASVFTAVTDAHWVGKNRNNTEFGICYNRLFRREDKDIGCVCFYDVVETDSAWCLCKPAPGSFSLRKRPRDYDAKQSWILLIHSLLNIITSRWSSLQKDGIKPFSIW